MLRPMTLHQEKVEKEQDEGAEKEKKKEKKKTAVTGLRGAVAHRDGGSCAHLAVFTQPVGPGVCTGEALGQGGLAQHQLTCQVGELGEFLFVSDFDRCDQVDAHAPQVAPPCP